MDKQRSESGEYRKVAVIGGGEISQQHLKFLVQRDDVKLVAICDLSPAMARYGADRYGASDALTDYRHLLEKWNPEVVHVLTPPNTHVSIVKDCLRAGAHVIVEKPIALTLAGFQLLAGIAKERGLLLIEDHNYVFNKPIRQMRQIIADGAIGEVKDIVVRVALSVRGKGSRYADRNLPSPSHRLPAGMVHEFLPHLCSVALTFLPLGGADGEEFCEIKALWRNEGGGDLFKYDDLDALAIHRSGTHVHLRFTAFTKPECFAVEVWGTQGAVSTDLFQPFLKCDLPKRVLQLRGVLNQWAFGWHLVRASGSNLVNKLRGGDTYDGLHRFLSLSYLALQQGGTPPVTYDDMYRVSSLSERLLAEAGQE